VALGGFSSWGARVLAGAAAVAVSATTGYAADLSFKDAPAAGDKIEWTAYIQGTTDYVFRGVSQNRRDPALQGGVDVTYGMFYIGSFASKVNFDDPWWSPKLGAHAEIDLYGGIKPKVGDITFDFGIISYNYTDPKVNHAASFYDPSAIEFKAGASGTVLNDVNWTGTIFVSPDYFGELGTAVTLEGSLSKSLYKAGDIEFTGSATVGHVFFDKDKLPAFPVPLFELNSYTYYNVGVTAAFKAFSLDLRWWDTDLNETSAQCFGNTVGQCGSTVSLTAKVSF
jgi:uncharacterized protein (TIGR02001 family)